MGRALLSGSPCRMSFPYHSTCVSTQSVGGSHDPRETFGDKVAALGTRHSPPGIRHSAFGLRRPVGGRCLGAYPAPRSSSVGNRSHRWVPCETLRSRVDDKALPVRADDGRQVHRSSAAVVHGRYGSCGAIPGVPTSELRAAREALSWGALLVRVALCGCVHSPGGASHASSAELRFTWTITRHRRPSSR